MATTDPTGPVRAALLLAADQAEALATLAARHRMLVSQLDHILTRGTWETDAQRLAACRMLVAAHKTSTGPAGGSPTVDTRPVPVSTGHGPGTPAGEVA